MPQGHGRGSAPQEQFDWFSRRGRAEIRLFKTERQFEIHSLPSRLFDRSSICSEASAFIWSSWSPP